MSPTSVYEDTTACIEWGDNVVSGRERAKHIDIRKHLVTKGLKCPRVPCTTRSGRRAWRVSSEDVQAYVRDLRPQEGVDHQGSQVEPRLPLGGMCRHDLGVPMPEPEH